MQRPAARREVADRPSLPTCEQAREPGGFDRSLLYASDPAVRMAAIRHGRDCLLNIPYLWVDTGPGDPPTDPTLAPLIDRALASIEPPAPQVVTSPPPGSPVLTGLPMYLAVDHDTFTPVTGQVTAGQFTVTATLQPIQTVFDPGDQHHPRTCDGPGSHWTHGDRPGPDDCTHTYTHTPAHLHDDEDRDTYPLTTHVIYHATYTIDGPTHAGTYDLGTLDGPTTTLDITVTERRAVRTTNS